MNPEERNSLGEEAVLGILAAKGPDSTFSVNELRGYTNRTLTEEEVRSFQHVYHHLEKVNYAIWTGNHIHAVTEGRKSNSVREFRFGIQALRDGGLNELADRREAEQSSMSGLLKMLAERMEGKAFIIEPSELANFYLALKTSPLVILAGVSGTGKSKLPRLFAELTGSRFQHVSVQPQWADNADLLGYTSALGGNVFVEGEILKAIRAAHEDERELFIALLDEMNLAAVEHYFSDFLSVVETRRREGGEIVTDPLPLDLPAPPTDGTDPHTELRTMGLPPNLRVVGTANMDETTRLFSPKVLDRAFSIEFDEVDLTTFANVSEEESDSEADFSPLARRLLSPDGAFVHEAYPKAEALFDRAAELLEAIKQELQKGSITFGYRTRDQVLMYLHHWQEDGLSDILDLNAAFDLCVLQKVLPKISGTSAALEKALDDLQKWLAKEHEESGDEGTGLIGPFLRSAEKVEWMRQRLGIEGATSFWTS